MRNLLTGLPRMSVSGKTAPMNRKLRGRAFYESIGSPKIVLAPMVDRSEFAWRMLTRSFLEPEARKIIAYSPMLHSRLFKQTAKFRDSCFQPTRDSLVSPSPSSSKPWLDGNPETDRPLFVQFCSNDPEDFLDSARYVAPYCDAVDLNLGCPQGIARSGHYGAFLQEDWGLIYRLINKLDRELSIPVTVKFRILESKERTLEYAKMILSAGASIITVHARRREQKGHNMGLADWSYIRYLRENLPPETVIFANGNILSREDLQPCLEATGADAVMSAEGNLSDPSIFAKPPLPGQAVREYWRGQEGQDGYRIDAVIRRYLDIIHRHVLEKEPPVRRPLFLPSDPAESPAHDSQPGQDNDDGEPAKKKPKKRSPSSIASPSLKAMQGHLFQILRPIVNTHTEIRDALAQCHLGDMAAFENVLAMIESAVRQALLDEASNTVKVASDAKELANTNSETIAKYKKPWWVCQPYIRPLPEQAIESGALTVSKKELARRMKEGGEPGTVRSDGKEKAHESRATAPSPGLPKEPLVCG